MATKKTDSKKPKDLSLPKPRMTKFVYDGNTFEYGFLTIRKNVLFVQFSATTLHNQVGTKEYILSNKVISSQELLEDKLRMAAHKLLKDLQFRVNMNWNE